MLNATPFLRLYARWRLARLAQQSIAEVQKAQLFSLINRSRDTAFGRDHDFRNIQSVSDFQKACPLRSYDDFWKQYWKPVFPNLTDCTWPGNIPYFAVSSGTSTGATKYIPLTHEMLRSNTRAGMDMLSYHVHNRPHSKIFAGRNFMLGGSTRLVEEAPGIYSGDLSGITTKALPWWAKLRYFPPEEIAHESDWELKMSIFADLAPQSNIRMIAGVPSWMLIFFEKLFERYPEKEPAINSFFPDLEMIIHGGVSFGPYQDRFLSLLKGGQTELREVYPASEGFIATADRGYGKGLRLTVDHGIFFEFVPFEELGQPAPTRHWLGNVETGVNYALILTTCSGLWSYIVGDTVRFIDTSPPRILITGRTSYYLSAFGEHLISEEIENAINAASKEIGAQISDYSVGAIFPDDTEVLGGHLFIIEFANHQPDAQALSIFERKLDSVLCEENEDYEAHRAEGFGLKPPAVFPVNRGVFKEWMKSRGKYGGQNKVPRIITDTELFDNLKQFVGAVSE